MSISYNISFIMYGIISYGTNHNSKLVLHCRKISGKMTDGIFQFLCNCSGIILQLLLVTLLLLQLLL